MNTSAADANHRPRCPHDRYLLDRAGRCWYCHKTPDEWETETKQKERPMLHTVTEDEIQALKERATVSVAGGEPIALRQFEDLARGIRPPVDLETGEVPRPYQPTLDHDLFPATERRQVPMVKVGLSGSIEMSMTDFEAYCAEGLEPGRIVQMTVTAYLPDPHARWVKRARDDGMGGKTTFWELEGVVKAKVLELGSFELGGIYDGE